MANEAQLQAMQALMQMSGEQRLQLLQEFKKPVGKIAESPKNRPRYDVMADQNYTPRPNPQYGAFGKDVLVQKGEPAPTPAAAPQAPQAQNSGGGLFDWLSGMLGGGGAQAKPPGPTVNSQTGLPMGTMAGDPAWLDQQVAGAPRAISIPGVTPVAPQDYSQASQDALALLTQVQQPGGALQSLAEGNQIADTWGSLLTGHGNLPKDFGSPPMAFGGLPDNWDPVKLPSPVKPTIKSTAPTTPKKGKKGLDYSASDFEKEPGGQALRWLADLIQPRPQ